MIGRVPDATRSLRPRRKPGWWRWHARSPKSWVYPHELWTTRLLAAHARRYAPSAGHPSLGNLAQGTVCKILAGQHVKPHKVRYYLEKRDPDFELKMAEILCVYRQVAVLREQAASGESQDDGGGSLAIVSYDEKPGIQALATTAPDRPPLPGTSPTVMRDHEYKRHGTLTLMDRSRSRPGQGPPSQPRLYRVPQTPRCRLPSGHRDRGHP